MKQNISDIAAAVLAGGKNTRMGGKNKALINIEGSPVIERTLVLLKEIFPEVIVVTNSPDDYKHYTKDITIIADIIKNIGPLGGIHSALSNTSKGAVFFVACDMPFLHNDIIAQQTEQFYKLGCDALIPKIEDTIEPLCAIYKKALKDNLYSYLQKSNDYSIKGFLETIDVYYLDIADNPFNRRIFKNLNTPEDIKEITDGSKNKSLA